jgi:selenocysteine lyase/cysteine desulfurase
MKLESSATSARSSTTSSTINLPTSRNATDMMDKPPRDVIYFNNSGKTALPRSVQRAGELALGRECQPWEPQTSCTEEIRTLFAHIVHASSDDIAIVPSTGFAMTIFANNIFRGSSGGVKKVLILQDEMSSEIYAWQQSQPFPNVQVDFLIVPHPTSEQGWTPLIMSCLEEHHVDVCCLPQVHWSDGSYIDLTCIGHYCSDHQIIFIVDGTQSVGIMPMDVERIKCDALACSVHKWLLGPHGMSLVYIHPKYHDTWLPLDQHERSRSIFQDEVYDATENNIDEKGYPAEFVCGARRCDSGGKNNPILEPMICEGLRIVNAIQLDSAQSYLKRITDQILEGGKSIGFDVQPGPRCSHIIGLRPKSPEFVQYLTPEMMVQVANKLKENNIFLAVRCGAFRISPYLKSTSDDVDQLIEALELECRSIVKDC